MQGKWENIQMCTHKQKEKVFIEQLASLSNVLNIFLYNLIFFCENNLIGMIK